MVTNSSKAGSSAAPPHELNVWKFVESRAPELQGLHSVVAQRLDNNFQSQRNKRRRTTGHDDRVAKNKFRKRKTGVGVMGKFDSGRKDESKVPRRVRRRIDLKKNTSSGFGTSGDGTRRLRTHVWNAKRFTMTKLWGFHIPLGLHGSGRGSRALLKKFKSGALIHDASYYGCVQMEGPEGTLISVLSSVGVPSSLAYDKETWNGILDGTNFGTAMIYHAGKPCDPPIAPMTYMWRPVQLTSTNEDGLNTDGFDGGQIIGDGNIVRQLWIWIHAAAFQEAYDALCSACEGLVNSTSPVRCLSREGQLAQLELMGSKAFHLLQKSLLPATSEHSGHTKKCLANKRANPGELEKISFFKSEDQISFSTVVPLVVQDPRTLTKREKTIVPEGNLFVHEECDNKEQPFSSLPENESEHVFEIGDLWDSTEGVYPPVQESVLCMEKQHQRMEFFRLGHKSSGSQSASVDGKNSRVCPIVLLRQENHEDSVARYTIILPLSWVQAFWITLISNGAHAIGLREKHWISCMSGLPYFPLDFPDCEAFSSLLRKETNAFCEKARSLEIPMPPPWDVVHLTLEKFLSKVENPHSQAAEFSIQDGNTNLARNSIHGKVEVRDSDCQGVPYQCSVVRTSSILNDFLNNASANKLLLFPKLRGQKSCLNKFMKDSEFLKQETAISGANCAKTSFCLRVLVRAYKEGVFEQGATVCAPHVADISLWTTARSETDTQNLQIPQCLLQLLPSAGSLQVHEELAQCESYRWPIGFVTTGFVRGSKKAVAVAVCEASLLSRLREEQWNAFPVNQRRKEIYVLVRNTKSTAYRLALATIILEQQEEDVNFM